MIGKHVLYLEDAQCWLIQASNDQVYRFDWSYRYTSSNQDHYQHTDIGSVKSIIRSCAGVTEHSMF